MFDVQGYIDEKLAQAASERQTANWYWIAGNIIRFILLPLVGVAGVLHSLLGRLLTRSASRSRSSAWPRP